MATHIIIANAAKAAEVARAAKAAGSTENVSKVSRAAEQVAIVTGKTPPVGDVIDLCKTLDLSRQARTSESTRKAIDLTDLKTVESASPLDVMRPVEHARVPEGIGVSLVQADGQSVRNASSIKWDDTVAETIEANKGIGLELVKGEDEKYFFEVKDTWGEGYHRVDRDSVILDRGDAPVRCVDSSCAKYADENGNCFG